MCDGRDGLDDDDEILDEVYGGRLVVMPEVLTWLVDAAII